jgi:DNA polymerase-3 subunit gamma/tau
MSQYQSLYRKYRSQTFSDLVGQAAIVRALEGALAGDRVSHAYLFSGSRGTGKTSSARLLAKAVNCHDRAAGTSEPCNRCPSCVQIAAGAALDLIEIDAASNRGIDEIRDLREKVNLAPALGKRKVYIIDEAHMLTTEAFNALLKTLEEPPPHVVFVLCTTESQKVPLTVLGRCQQFHFRRLSEAEIEGRLAYIAGREGIEVEGPALQLIARTAQGSLRDAVGLLDQLVPLASGPISLESARELLGIADPARVEELVGLILSGQGREALAAVDRLYEAGAELRQVVRAIMERVRDLLLAAIDARDEAERARLSAALDALLHLDGEIRRHAEPRFLVEATLVRLAVDGSGQPAPPAITAAPVAKPASAAQPNDTPAPVPASVPPPPLAESPAPPAEPVPAAGAAEPDGWRALVDTLHPLRRGYYKEARAEIQGTVLILWFPYAFHHQKATEHLGEIEPLVKGWLGDSVTIELRLQEPATRSVAGGSGGERPAAGNGPGEPARKAAPEEHPMIQDLVRKLEGRVTRVREIRP